jgi:hypothetical protein
VDAETQEVLQHIIAALRADYALARKRAVDLAQASLDEAVANATKPVTSA